MKEQKINFAKEIKDSKNKLPFWKILISDDDKEVHAMTNIIAKNIVFEGKGLEIINAYSAEETKKIISKNNDIAILLLDVVMEKEDSGLEVIKYIRNNLKNKFIRIIIRTGQPGQAPERDVISNYDINDYREKTELTSKKFYSVIISALRSYRDLITIENSKKGLQQIIKASSNLYIPKSLKQFSHGILTQLTSLLRIKDGLLYFNSGFSAEHKLEKYFIIAATGNFSKYVNKNIKDVVTKEIYKKIKIVSKKEKSMFFDNDYIGFFKSKAGVENYLFLKGETELTELDKDLLTIFSINIGIAFDNINYIIEQQEIKKELINTKNFLNNVFNSVTSLLISVDSKGKITQINNSAIKYLKTKNIYSYKYWDVLPFLNKYKDKFNDAIKNKEVIEYYGIYFDNIKQYLNLSIYPLRNEGAVIKIDDVTEFKEKENQLLQAQKMESIGNLASGLAHDLNNVLGGICGTVSIIKYYLNKNKKLDLKSLSKYLTTIEVSGNRAADIVKQLLSISTKKNEISLIPVNLNNSIKNVIKICKNSFNKSIIIKSKLFKGKAIIKADPSQVEQTLLNFCINAEHSMTLMKNLNSTLGGTLTISLNPFIAPNNFKYKNLVGKEYWQVKVIDTGVGMTKKTIFKIFDPFFTTKKEGRGSGLGLSMVQNMIKNHDGFIEVESKVDKGSTFIIYFPKYDCDDLKKNTRLNNQIYKGSGLILVVDDEEHMRKLAKDILENCGYKVICANNGAECIDIYKTKFRKIKAVFLDISMPVISGEQTYLALKKINPEVKTLITSGYENQSRVANTLKNGAKVFIQKPYTFLQLAKSIYKTAY